MTPDPIEAVALALRAEANNFANPVSAYVEPEAQARWENANPDGDYFSDVQPRELDSWEILAAAAMTAMPKVETLAAENARLRKALERAAFIFATYAAVHRGKNTEGAEAKAASNEVLAEEMRAALTPEPDTIGYVDDTGGAR